METSWAAVLALGAIAGTGVYFYQSADNSRNVASQNVVRSDAGPTHATDRFPEATPQPLAYPTTSTIVRGGPEFVISATASSAFPATPEQQQTFDRLRDRLHDLAFRRTHTYREFLAISMPDWESLPEDMRSQIMVEITGMVERGEFGPNHFVAEQEMPEPVTAPWAAPSSPPTAEQQRTYESIRSKLRDPGFTQTKTLNELATLPELQTLPAELRQQLEREALEMLDRGALQLRPEARASAEP